jgi:exodeoxyribonuclease-5
MRNGKHIYTPNDEGVDKYTQGLTEDQHREFFKMRDFLYRKGDEMYVVKGYAGTGKTFLISRLIDYCKNNKEHFGKKSLAVMTAPTNKAVQVLRDSSPYEIRQVADFKTVHQLLGLKEHINENGQIEYKNSFDEAPTFSSYLICVIDEISMLNDELFYLIKNNASNVKIIMMGDPLQVPPIGKIDCEPFLNPEDHNITTGELSKIMRQKEGSKIIELSMFVRENAEKDFTIDNVVSDDLTVLDAVNDKPKAVSMISDWFKPNTDIKNTKVVAWTNAKVNEYNRYIRQVHYGLDSKNRLIKGERMIANEPVIKTKNVSGRIGSSIVESIILFTSQEFDVIGFGKSTMNYSGMDGKVIEIPVYDINIEYYDFDTMGMERTSIQMIHEDGQHIYTKTLEKLKNAALYAPSHKKKYFWKEFYKFKRTFADVSYAYAITIHKAQGSTYNKVIVDANNINLNQNILERNRIFYTAITRAKHHTLIIN